MQGRTSPPATWLHAEVRDSVSGEQRETNRRRAVTNGPSPATSDYLVNSSWKSASARGSSD
jgi:hypothetical protein